MSGGENLKSPVGVRSSKSDVVEILRPVVTLSRILLCFPRLKCDLSSERSGLVSQVLQVVSTILVFSAAIYVLGMELFNFLQEDPANRLRDTFSLFMWFSYVAVSSAFYFVSSYKNGILIRLIHLHNDVASTVSYFGHAISVFKVENRPVAIRVFRIISLS